MGSWDWLDSAYGKGTANAFYNGTSEQFSKAIGHTPTQKKKYMPKYNWRTPDYTIKDGNIKWNGKFKYYDEKVGNKEFNNYNDFYGYVLGRKKWYDTTFNDPKAKPIIGSGFNSFIKFHNNLNNDIKKNEVSRVSQSINNKVSNIYNKYIQEAPIKKDIYDIAPVSYTPNGQTIKIGIKDNIDKYKKIKDPKYLVGAAGYLLAQQPSSYAINGIPLNSVRAYKTGLANIVDQLDKQYKLGLSPYQRYNLVRTYTDNMKKKYGLNDSDLYGLLTGKTDQKKGVELLKKHINYNKMSNEINNYLKNQGYNINAKELFSTNNGYEYNPNILSKKINKQYKYKPISVPTVSIINNEPTKPLSSNKKTMATNPYEKQYNDVVNKIKEFDKKRKDTAYQQQLLKGFANKYGYEYNGLANSFKYSNDLTNKFRDYVDNKLGISKLVKQKNDLYNKKQSWQQPTQPIQQVKPTKPAQNKYDKNADINIQALQKMANMSGEQLQKVVNDAKWGKGGFGVYTNGIINNTTNPKKRKQLQDLVNQIDIKRGQEMQGQQKELDNIAKKLNNGQPVPVGTSVADMTKELGYNKRFDNLNTYIQDLKTELVNKNSDLNKNLKDYYSKTDTLLSDKISGLKEEIGSDVGEKVKKIGDEFDTKMKKLGTKLTDELTETTDTVNNSISKLGTKLGLQTDKINEIKSYYDILKQRVNLNNNLLQTQNKIFDTTFDSLKNNLRKIATEYGATYKKISDRIDRYETNIKDTYAKMEENLQNIGKNYRTVLKFNQAAAGSAAEKMLRAKGGKGSQLRVANYLQGLAQKGAADLATLQTNLLTQQNGLEQTLLNLKRQVVNNKNINDEKKAEIVDNITNKYNNLLNLNKTFKIKLAELKTKPYEDALDYKKKQVAYIEGNQIQQKIEEANQKWLNTPTGREKMLASTLAKVNVVVPKSIIDKVLNATSYIDSIRFLNNYLIRAGKREAASKLGSILNVYNKNKTGTQRFK